MAISSAVVPARSPERVIDSPYDGRKKGKNIITKIPNPKPLTRCMKLAAMVSTNISSRVVSIFSNKNKFRDRAFPSHRMHY